jgi:dihydrofolate synthase/folylpolyglutamate synthase
MFRVLGPLFARAFVTRFSNNPRSVPPEQLAALWAKASQAPVEVCPTPAEALARARGEAGPDDLICVTGSVFLAGEVRPLLVGED